MFRAIQKSIKSISDVSCDRDLKRWSGPMPYLLTSRYLCTIQSPAIDKWKATLDEEKQQKLHKISEEVKSIDWNIKTV